MPRVVDIDGWSLHVQPDGTVSLFVDDDDRALAALEGGVPDDVQRFVDAVNETIEAQGSSPNLPDDLVKAWAAWPDGYRRKGDHDEYGPFVMQILARSPHWRARYVAAGSTHLTPELVEMLTWDDDPQVARAALAQPSCPPERLAWATTSDDSQIVRVAAGHPSTPADALTNGILTTRRGEKINEQAVEAMVANPGCHPDVLVAIHRTRKVPSVWRKRARHHPNWPDQPAT